jgi:hypothetical protein
VAERFHVRGVLFVRRASRTGILKELSQGLGRDFIELLGGVRGSPTTNDQGSRRQMAIRKQVEQTRKELLLRQVPRSPEHHEAQALSADLDVVREGHVVVSEKTPNPGSGLGGDRRE